MATRSSSPPFSSVESLNLAASSSVQPVEISVGTTRFHADLTFPSAARGWVILAPPPAHRSISRAQIDQARDYFNAAGLATLVTEEDPVDRDRVIGPAAERLSSATEWLHSQADWRDMPINYFGFGTGAAVSLQAAAQNSHVAMIATWNGRPELAWWSSRFVTAPTLLLVSQREAWLAQWLNRLAHWRLAGRNELLIVPGDLSDALVRTTEWFYTNGQSVRRHARRSTTQLVIQRAATGAAIMVLALPLVAPARSAQLPSTLLPMTQATQVQNYDAFDDGVVIPSSQVRGDSKDTASQKATVGVKKDQKPQKHTGRRGQQVVRAGEIKGDPLGPQRPAATGAHQLVDGIGLKWFINDNITFNTSSSASAAMSEASFTASGPVTTANGGTTTAKLNDAFDGYNSLCFSLNGATGPCQTGNIDYTMYLKNGPAVPDVSCAGTFTTTARQYLFNTQVVSGTGLEVSRKVYIPDDYGFARWLNVFTNTNTSPLTVTMITGNNLGSDSNTRIVNSSLGPITPTLTNTQVSWVTTFQNYAGTTSTDPRLGHVLQGTNAPTPLTKVNFADGDDNPYWAYDLTLQPGETKIIMNFATGQLSNTASAQQAAWLTTLPTPTLRCMTSTERQQVVNFANYDVSVTPTATAKSGDPGAGVVYTLQVTNTGSLTDTYTVGVTQTWPTAAPPTIGALAAGASASVNFTVTVPSNAAGGASDMATVTLTSQGDATKSATSTLTTTANNVYQVNLSPAVAAKSGNPGTNVVYTLQVTNTGDITDTYTVGVTQTWPTAAPPTIGALAAGANASVSFTVTVPSNAAGGASDMATVTLTSQGDATKSATSILTTTTNNVYQVNLSPAVAAKSGNPGTNVVYTLQVTNTGNITDTYTVGVTQTWPTAAPPTIGALAAGASASVNFTVTVPANAAGGASDTATVTLTSQGDATKSATSILTTTANNAYNLNLSAPSAAKKGYVGKTVAYSLTLTNNGNAPGQFNISVTGNTWPTTAPVSFTLNVSESKTFPVQVTIPLTATRLATDMVSIKAVVQASPTISASLPLTTTADKYQVYLPLILK